MDFCCQLSKKNFLHYWCSFSAFQDSTFSYTKKDIDDAPAQKINYNFFFTINSGNDLFGIFMRAFMSRTSMPETVMGGKFAAIMAR